MMKKMLQNITNGLNDFAEDKSNSVLLGSDQRK